MSSLSTLLLNYNPLEGFPEEDDTFADCPFITLLEMDHSHLTRLPNMTYLPNLIEFTVNHARLNYIPDDICCTCSRLGILQAENNRITNLPTLSCKHLAILDFSHNHLETLHDDLLKGMRHMNIFNVQENSIRDLSHDFFINSINMEFIHIGGNQLTQLPYLGGMPHLVFLNASYNKIRGLYNRTFSEQVLMDSLYLNNNEIDFIDPTAFPIQSDLKILNLSRNGDLREWVVPVGGFPRLGELYLEEMFGLHQVPHPKDLPLITELHLSYSYHCCIYEQFPGLYEPNVTELETEGSGIVIIELPTAPDITDHPNEVKEGQCGITDFDRMNLLSNFPNLIFVVNSCQLVELRINSSMVNLSMFNDTDSMQHFFSLTVSRSGFDLPVTYRDKVRCTPRENPLTPCQFLLDPWVLKVAIWAVWVLALLGNGTVLFIGIATREKLESNELLICNLAFADFCMGVYLAFLAIVDVRTFGSSFFQSALDWQLGPGCKAAGFIAVFSSELSIYTLVMLTLERVYTLSHALNSNEAKRKRVVIFLCVLGWVVAAGLAILPIFGINSYDRVAVCLPYLTERAIDKAYIGFILSINVVSFLIIIFSYVYIFSIVCKSAPATNISQRRKDMLVAATKIAVVIVTAFLCWTPIAVIGYLAIFDVHLVDAKEAKFFIVFVYPLNACVDPFIYAIFTKRFRSKFGSIFRRSKSRVTSFPPNHHMRLQRIPSAFSSEYQMTKLSSTSPTSRQEELTRLRQSRRSSSLVVQMIGTNNAVPSPTFSPPSGCNLGRRASLPPGFGSTLNVAGLQDESGEPLPHYSIVPFRLGSVYYSSDNSSLPNLQEESAMDLEADAVFSSSAICGDDLVSNPLTSSQESNLRRLSVVKEEEEAGLPTVEGEELDGEGGASDEDGSLESSSDEYSDASDSLSLGVGGVGGTDLDRVMEYVDVVIHDDATQTPLPTHLVAVPTVKGRAEGREARSSTSSPLVSAASYPKAYSCEDLHKLSLDLTNGNAFASSPIVNCISSQSLERLASSQTPGGGSDSDLETGSKESPRQNGCSVDPEMLPVTDHTPSGRGHGMNGIVARSEGEICPIQALNSQTLIKSLHQSSAQPTPINSTHSNPPANTPLSHSPSPTQPGSKDASQSRRSNHSRLRKSSRETDL
jgi:hypothetical protein